MMISPSVEAVFEQGVFRPLTPIQFLIQEGQPLKINIETKSDCNDVLKLATSVYDGLSEPEIDNIEQIALDRTHFLNEGKHTE
ncbi:MAG: antitoxin family protein [Pseudomonadota bacterium]